MARLVVRIAPNDHPTDPSLTPLRTLPGDVVEIVEDGHQFSLSELNCGQYRFIDVPRVLSEQFLSLKQPVEDAEGRMIKRRALALDVTALRSGQWAKKTTATKTQIDSIIVTRA